jgi:hypothetical protein
MARAKLLKQVTSASACCGDGALSEVLAAAFGNMAGITDDEVKIAQ